MKVNLELVVVVNFLMEKVVVDMENVSLQMDFLYSVFWLQ